MPISSPSTPSLVPNTQNSSGASVKSVANVLRLQSQQSEDASLWSSASDALTAIQRQLDFIMNALRSAIPQPDPIQVTAPDGSLIAEIGILLDQQTNTSYSGIWGNNLFIGGNGPSSAPLFSNGLVTIIGKNGFLELQDGSGNIIGLIGVFTDPNTGNPFSGLWTNHLFVGGTGPDSSPLFSNGTETAIGKNGYVGVLDPYNNLGAWLGTQSESSQNISGRSRSLLSDMATDLGIGFTSLVCQAESVNGSFLYLTWIMRYFLARHSPAVEQERHHGSFRVERLRPSLVPPDSA